MILETIDFLLEQKTQNSKSSSGIAKLKDLLDINKTHGSLKRKLQDSEIIIAQLFEATGCSIILFNKSKLKSLNSHTNLSIDNHSQKANSRENPTIGEKSMPDQVGSCHKTDVNCDFMACPLVNHSRVIGSISIHSPKSRWHLRSEGFELLEVVACIIIKMIQLNQLHNLINMRYQSFASGQVFNTVSSFGITIESPHPVHTAKALAKFIYRDMVKAGFDHKHIIYAASEIISELNNDLRNSALRSKLD